MEKEGNVCGNISFLPPSWTVLIDISVKDTPNQEDRAHPAAVLN